MRSNDEHRLLQFHEAINRAMLRDPVDSLICDWLLAGTPPEWMPPRATISDTIRHLLWDADTDDVPVYATSVLYAVLSDAAEYGQMLHLSRQSPMESLLALLELVHARDGQSHDLPTALPPTGASTDQQRASGEAAVMAMRRVFPHPHVLISEEGRSGLSTSLPPELLLFAYGHPGGTITVREHEPDDCPRCFRLGRWAPTLEPRPWAQTLSPMMPVLFAVHSGVHPDVVAQMAEVL